MKENGRMDKDGVRKGDKKAGGFGVRAPSSTRGRTGLHGASDAVNHWSGLCGGLDVGWVTPRDTQSPESLF